LEALEAPERPEVPETPEAPEAPDKSDFNFVAAMTAASPEKTVCRDAVVVPEFGVRDVSGDSITTSSGEISRV